jgi:hypothetical protein
MDDFDLPPELIELELRLAERDRAKPSPAFRQRVLSAMREELAVPGIVLFWQGSWRVVATAAVAALLCLNLAISLSNHRAWPRVERIEVGIVEAAVREMRQRHPELSEEEAYQLVVLVQLVPALKTAPALSSSLDKIILLERDGSWDMH